MGGEDATKKSGKREIGRRSSKSKMKERESEVKTSKIKTKSSGAQQKRTSEAAELAEREKALAPFCKKSALDELFYACLCVA
jgi:hypothetical protein